MISCVPTCSYIITFYIKGILIPRNVIVNVVFIGLTRLSVCKYITVGLISVGCL